jgi:beta-glucanase (GH16 family)
MQLQKPPGHWSAFWLMGNGVGKVGNDGRDGTEIEIMDTVAPWQEDSGVAE